MGPEQVVGGWAEGAAWLAVTFRKVNRPRVPLPATFSSLVVVPGYCRLIVLGAPFPENVIFTGSCCATFNLGVANDRDRGPALTR